MIVVCERLGAINDPTRVATPENCAIAAAVVRETADLIDEIGACLTGEGSEAFKEAIANV